MARTSSPTEVPTQRTLLTEQEAAAFLGIKPNTLAVWRSSRRYDLPYIKVGGLVRYRLSAVERFLDDRTVTAESGE